MMRHVIAVLASLLSASAFAQVPPPGRGPQQSAPLHYATDGSLTANNPAARFQFLADLNTFPVLSVFNAGTVDAYISMGDVTVTADNTGMLVPAGQHVAVWITGAYVSGFAASADTLRIQQWTGAPSFTGAGSAVIAGVLPAGGNTIGKVGIDQTTPGTTDHVTAIPAAITKVTLDIKTVTTGGAAVAAISAGNALRGGWIMNPETATINLCINEIGTAAGTSSSGDTTCIKPGTVYQIAPGAGAVSVISSDSAHPFSGMGFK